MKRIESAKEVSKLVVKSIQPKCNGNLRTYAHALTLNLTLTLNLKWHFLCPISLYIADEGQGPPSSSAHNNLFQKYFWNNLLCMRLYECVSTNTSSMICRVCSRKTPIVEVMHLRVMKLHIGTQLHRSYMAAFCTSSHTMYHMNAFHVQLLAPTQQLFSRKKVVRPGGHVYS